MAVNGKLDHPHIVKTYGGFVHQGNPYLVQEYLDGDSVGDLVKQGAILNPDDILKICIATAESLQHLHIKGLVHGDIKPANLMRLSNGDIKLIDYGLSFLSSSCTADQVGFSGTIGFMSPEQASGRTKIDHRADIYSLGKMLTVLTEQARQATDHSSSQDFLESLLLYAKKMSAERVSDRPTNAATVINTLKALQKQVAERTDSGHKQIKEKVTFNRKKHWKIYDSQINKSEQRNPIAPRSGFFAARLIELTLIASLIAFELYRTI